MLEYLKKGIEDMKCKICNKEFQSFLELTIHLVKDHNYKADDLYKYYEYSFETREATCPICGKKFIMEWRQLKKHKEGTSRGITCGRKCAVTFMNLVYGNPSCRPEVKEKKKQKALDKYGVENVFQAKDVKEKIKQTNLEKYGVEYAIQSSEILEKSKKTNLDKYGVGHVSQRKDIKERKKKKSLEKYGVENISQAEEVKEKKKQSALEKYGVEYTLQAPEVREKGKETIFKRYGVEFATQAEEVKEKMRQSNLEKYGFKYASQAEEIKNKVRKTIFERYGVEYASQSPEIQERIKQTNLEKYGVEYVLQAEEIKEKIKRSIEEKYGVKFASQAEEVKEKTKQTNLERYGIENISQIPEIKEKIKQTNLEKYGVEYTLQSPEIREKGKKTNLEKYGFEWAVQSPEVKEKIKQTNLNKFGVEFATQSPEVQEKTRQTNLKKYGVSYTGMAEEVQEKVKQTNLEKYGVEFFCQHEKCMKANGKRISGINKRFHEFLENRGIENSLEFIIENYGYDLKAGNTLIEIDPYFTHNVTKGPYLRGKERPTIPLTYHLEKTNFAKEKGYNCIHVFDWEDWNKVAYLLQDKEKVAARKCEVKEISRKEADEFLSSHHLQGTTKQVQYAYGLLYGGELVEVMTFGKPRYNKNYEYELLRLCTAPKISVVGGASKLLKFFEEQVKPKSIISYCDLSKFNGEVYEKLGFKLKEQTAPARHWYNFKTRRHITDNLLRQRGFDQLHDANFGKGTSNEELMKEHDYVEIYDCGQFVFVKKY